MKVFVLYSYENQNADFEVEIASSNALRVLEKCKDYGLTEYYEEDNDTPLTAEIIDLANFIDFGSSDMGRRFVLDTVLLDYTPSEKMFGVFVNGDEYGWEGSMEGLFKTGDEAIDFILEQIDAEDWEEEEFRNKLRATGTLTDSLWLHWKILELKPS